MRNYETVIILKPQMSDSEIADFMDKTKKLITSNGGEILLEDKMGRRRLTHPINHVRDGFYVFMKFKSEPQPIAEMNQQMRVNELVMRCGIFHIEERKAKPVKTKKAPVAEAPKQA